MSREEKKKNGAERRFNFLDAILILLVVLCVVGVWQRGNLQRLFSGDDAQDTYTVTFQVKKMRSTTVELLKKDTALYLKSGEDIVSFGVLTQPVSTAAATAYFEDEDGNVVSAVYPQDAHEYLLDVTGTVQCRGLERDGSFFLEGKTYLAVSQSVQLSTELADFEVVVTAITKN